MTWKQLAIYGIGCWLIAGVFLYVNPDGHSPLEKFCIALAPFLWIIAGWLWFMAARDKIIRK